MSESLSKRTASEMYSSQTPLLRVSLFGKFQFAWQIPIDTQVMAWDGRTSARAVFKLLLCAPGRQASKSLLAGILWPDTDEEKALSSLRSAIKVLRQVLGIPGGESLLIQVSGDLLILADQSRLWVDTDAFEEMLAAASRASSPDAALPLWEQANALLRGEFLADDQGYEWTAHRLVKKRRQVLWMARCRMVRHLADAYIQRGQIHLAEEILDRHIVTFPTDQDALYRLLVLLEQQECFEQAKVLYERTLRMLEAAGKQPAKHVTACYERLQKAAYVQKQQDMQSHISVLADRSHQDSISASQQQSTQMPLQVHLASDIRKKDVVDYFKTKEIKQKEPILPPQLMVYPSPTLPSTQDSLYILSKGGLLVPTSTTMQMIPSNIIEADCATWFGYKQAQILAWIDAFIEEEVSVVEFQHMLDMELKMFEEAKLLYRSDEYTLSRRQLLVALAMLPLGRFMKAQQGRRQEDFFLHCATSLTACWHLMQGKEFSIIEEILSAYIPFLVSQIQLSSLYRLCAAGLASQAYRLKGIIALHRNNLNAREYYCQKAVYYSEIAEDMGLHVAALISLASTYYYDQSPTKAASTYKQALLHQKSIPRLQQSRLYAELAVVAAQEGQVKEALMYQERGREVYPEHPERDPSFLYAEFSPASMILEEGLAYLALSSRFPTDGYGKQAWKTFGQFELLQAQGDVPERIRYEIINHQAETALILRDREAFEVYLKQGIEGARLLKSQQRRQEIVNVYKKAREIVWPDEARIRDCAELFLD